MAISTCPTCHNTTFEMVGTAPANTRFNILFVQCVNCGAVVGTMPYLDAGVLADSLQHEVAKIQRRMDFLEELLEKIRRHLGIQ